MPDLQLRRSRRPMLLCAALGSLVLACNFEPEAGSLTYQLSEDSQTRLSEAAENGEISSAEAVGGQILGALEMLFGTPSAPQLLVLDDVSRNGGGYDELSEAAFDEIKAENEKRFKLALQLLEARRYTEIWEPRYAEDLWRRWQETYLPELLENPDAPFDPDDEELGTWHEEAAYLFASWYPTLNESAEMYRAECLHCHGVEGGGDGPTSPYLNPLPRDYRQGKFKWVGVERNTAPRREDLLRILHQGSYTTAMPSFSRYSRGQLEGLIDYVRLLAMRGEVESRLVDDAIDNGALPPGAPLEWYAEIWSKWDDAPDKLVSVDDVVRPDAVTPEMLEHGRELFEGEAGACSTCHGLDGRGGGIALFVDEPQYEGQEGEVKLDEDGAPMRSDDGAVVLKYRKLDEWGNESDPRNFHRAVFRGGNRPIDLYRRIKGGIGGTIMPAASDQITDEDIWSLVYYVLSIAEKHDVARAAEARQHALAAAEEAEHGTEEEGSH